MRFLADINFRDAITRGLRHRDPALAIIRAQTVGFDAADDADVWEWAAAESCILLTHDRSTIPHFAWQRVAANQPMPGVIVVDSGMPNGQAIDDLWVLATCTEESYWENRVEYLSG
jgi:predicted nuclease of predicted toxin-antitoxin system